MIHIFRFEKAVKEDITHYLVTSALKLSAYGKVGFSLLLNIFLLLSSSCGGAAQLEGIQFQVGYCFCFVQLMLLTLLKGVGSEVMHIKDVELLLDELLNRRHQFHLGNDQFCTKLSKTEINTMCLLLEVITLYSICKFRFVPDFVLHRF